MVFFLGKAPFSAEMRRPAKGIVGIVVVVALIAMTVFGWTVYEQITAAKEKAKIGTKK